LGRYGVDVGEAVSVDVVDGHLRRWNGGPERRCRESFDPIGARAGGVCWRGQREAILEAMEMAGLVRRERPMFAELFDWLEGEVPLAFRPFGGGHMMRVEDYVDAGHYVIRAELPGIDPDKDVTVTVESGVLTVKAERREETKEARRSEFRYGAFTRSVSLPAGADESDVTATYGNGILEIRIGIKPERKPEARKIPITAG
jgi:HSP20 family molecular chaperone IbpA